MAGQAPFIPYARQALDRDDLAAVAEVLASDWLTTGPKVAEFEASLAASCGAAEVAAVSNGTAALHLAMLALGVGPGDEVVVPAMTFAASANCVLYAGATPVFADVDPDSLLLDLASAEARITPRTKALIAVDYAGQPCDWDGLRELAGRRGLALVDDGCHALGAAYRGRPVGSLADLTCFSFHPVKHIATGEGGAVATDRPDLAAAVRRLRNHGIMTDARQREEAGTWFYEMQELGFNYRLTDIQCALGLSQLRKLPGWLARRRELAARYARLLADISGAEPLALLPDREHAWHLYVVRLAPELAGEGRRRVFEDLRAAGVGVNVHYVPVYLHPYYRKNLGAAEGLCPRAEAAYSRIISLPMYPGLSDADQDRVVGALDAALRRAAG
ncbi:MAG: UDP-4-amino-4,6-dideoxy-N-acetyl-beta-L-altrosamine transaminase [Thermodesulfobacteriota bacterium]